MMCQLYLGPAHLLQVHSNLYKCITLPKCGVQCCDMFTVHMFPFVESKQCNTLCYNCSSLSWCVRTSGLYYVGIAWSCNIGYDKKKSRNFKDSKLVNHFNNVSFILIAFMTNRKAITSITKVPKQKVAFLFFSFLSYMELLQSITMVFLQNSTSTISA